MSLPVGTHVLKDPEAVAREAAERIIVACGETRSERIALCLSGGSTPKVLYGLLAGPDYAARVPWERIHWFFGDDRAVPWDDPRSNVRMVREAFGRGSRIPPTHLHFIPSDAGLGMGRPATVLTPRSLKDERFARSRQQWMPSVRTAPRMKTSAASGKDRWHP